eukprot:jgi/Tetstr1/455714/TSEL_042521.t1
MAFSGPAPEVINGRLAMLGFAAALGAELSTGQTGKKETTFGPFTPGAEMLNGRAAMIGFASLLAYEAFKGSPLF